MGVSEASSWPDVLLVGQGGWAGGSEARPQLPLPLQPVTSWVACAAAGLRLGSWVSLGPCRWPTVRAGSSRSLPVP